VHQSLKGDLFRKSASLRQHMFPISSAAKGFRKRKCCRREEKRSCLLAGSGPHVSFVAPSPRYDAVPLLSFFHAGYAESKGRGRRGGGNSPSLAWQTQRGEEAGEGGERRRRPLRGRHTRACPRFHRPPLRRLVGARFSRQERKQGGEGGGKGGRGLLCCHRNLRLRRQTG